MKLLWFLLSAAVMVQAWPHGMLIIVEAELKSKVPQEATKPVSEFFMREDAIQAYRMVRIGSRVKDGASSIASSSWQTDTTKTTNSEDRVKTSTSTMVSNVCQEDAATTTDSEDRGNGSASTIAPSVSQGNGTKHADSVNLVEVTTELVSRPKQEATSNVIDNDVTKPVTCELSINYYEEPDPEPQPEPTCIDNWEYCRDSDKPCCGQKKLEDGTLGHKYWTCFEFGQGICTPLHAIYNLDFFAKLIIKLNSTNYRELHDKYWQSVRLV